MTKGFGLLGNYCQVVGITVWATFLPFTACTHRMLLQKAEETENYEEKHDYLYLANCLLKGKHSFWHIVLLATHELTTDVFTNSARSKCYGLE